MSIFTDLIFIYVYIATLIFLKFINFDNDNYLGQKLYIFIAIMIFSGLMEVLKTFKTQCKRSGQEILSYAVRTGTVSVIGMAIYTDLLHMEWSRDTFIGINESDFHRSLIVPLLIVFALMVVKLTYVMVDSDEDKCEKLEN